MDDPPGEFGGACTNDPNHTFTHVHTHTPPREASAAACTNQNQNHIFTHALMHAPFLYPGRCGTLGSSTAYASQSSCHSARLRDSTACIFLCGQERRRDGDGVMGVGGRKEETAFLCRSVVVMGGGGRKEETGDIGVEFGVVKDSHRPIPSPLPSNSNTSASCLPGCSSCPWPRARGAAPPARPPVYIWWW